MIMLSVATVTLSAFSFCACGAEEDTNAPVELEIHDSYADIEDIGDGNAQLRGQAAGHHGGDQKG